MAPCVSECVSLCVFIGLPCPPTRPLLRDETTPKRDVKLTSRFHHILYNGHIIQSDWDFHFFFHFFLFSHRSLRLGFHRTVFMCVSDLRIKTARMEMLKYLKCLEILRQKKVFTLEGEKRMER